MFTGITAILLNDDSTMITRIASKEGEDVVFVAPVATVDHPRSISNCERFKVSYDFEVMSEVIL